jgi:hypothetical protein
MNNTEMTQKSKNDYITKSHKYKAIVIGASAGGDGCPQNNPFEFAVKLRIICNYSYAQA